jgi:hypothetical protein
VRKGALPWGPSIDQSDIIQAVIILFSDAGRIFGIDKLLSIDFQSSGFGEELGIAQN